MWSAFQRQWEHKFPGPKITPRVCNWGIWFYNRSRSHIFLTEPRINHYLLKSMWWKNLPVNHRSSKRRNQIYLISKLSFLYFEGRGLYTEAITINQETILSSKRGVITQWSRHDNVLLGFLFIWQTSLLISSGKTFSAKAKSVKKIFWPPRIDLFCQNSIVDVQFESRRGLFMIIATIVVKFKSIVRTLKYFKGWTFSNADPLSAIVVFSPIDYFSWLFRGGLMISLRSIILKLNQTRLHFCISL